MGDDGWAWPLPTLERTNRRSDMEKLFRIKENNGVTRIVVGLPLRMDGTSGAMAEEARAFGARVGKALGLPVELVDERLTSWEAAGSSQPGAAGGRKNRGEIDQRAAVLILEEHLRSGHRRK
jgi:putative Holliday junction resolvase